MTTHQLISEDHAVESLEEGGDTGDAAVPEPSAFVLFFAAVLACGWQNRRGLQ